MVIPEKLDPDEYPRKYGEASFQEPVAHGRETVFTSKSCYLKQGKNLENGKDKIEYFEELLVELNRVVSSIEQDMYLSQLSTEFRANREMIQKQSRKLRRISQQNRQEPQENQHTQIKRQEIAWKKRSLMQVEKAEQILLYRASKGVSARNILKERELQFIRDAYAEIHFLPDAYVSQHYKFNLAKFLDFLQDGNLGWLVMEIEYLSAAEESSPREIQDLLGMTSKSGLIDEITLKKQVQQEARRTGNKQPEPELTIEIINPTKQLK